MSVYSEEQQLDESHMPTVSIIFQPQGRQIRTSSPERWVFGGTIQTVKLNITPPHQDPDPGPQGSVVYRETTRASTGDGDEAEQIVSTTRRRKAKKQSNDPGGTQVLGDQEEFFEDELEVLDFAADRV
jgi:hypothetical protein